LAAPDDQVCSDSRLAAGSGKRPFWREPAGQFGRFETDEAEGVRGPAGPLPLPPGGMLCEFTRPTPH
jgi:hypothetical protein